MRERDVNEEEEVVVVMAQMPAVLLQKEAMLDSGSI